jgi:hypothetical protein
MIEALNWRAVEPPKNTLRGFCDLKLSPSGLVLHDCSLHSRPEGKRWIGLPVRPRIDSVTRLQSKDAATGKFQWMPIAERERFQAAALAATDRLLGKGGTP